MKNLTVEDVIKLDEWVSRGKTEEERKVRYERVRAQLFPEHLPDPERMYREQIVRLAEEAAAQAKDKEDPMPEVSALLGNPIHRTTVPAEPWEGLIKKDSPAFRRGQLHDGTRETLDAMRRKARGSPFFEEKKPAKK